MDQAISIRQDIAEFLESALTLHNETSRQALIYQAGLDKNLQNQIDFAGSTNQFIQMLIPILINYGKLTDGRDAIVAVLEAIKKNVGTERRETCETLIAEWNKLQTLRQKEPSNQKKNVRRQYYLNALRERVAHLNMSQIAPGRSDEIPLESIYIPLPTNLSLNIEIKNYKIIDWSVGNNQLNTQGVTNISFSKSSSQEYDMISEQSRTSLKKSNC
jgi:hypothetical protein